MGEELSGQSVKVDALQCRAEATGQGLRSVAAGAGRLAGPAPKRRQGGSSGWDGGTCEVARAAARVAPLAARYASR